MSLDSAVPPKLYILRYPCRVWYKDQPLDCRICESPSHRAADCPLRGLCRKCRQPGHFERNCPGVPPPADAAPTASPADDAPPASDTVPSESAAPSVSADADAVSDTASSGDDEDMGDSDLASGDEEVLAAAGRVTLSSRRTRPSTRAASCSPDFSSSFVLPPSIPPSVCRDSAPSSSVAEPSPVAADPVSAPVSAAPPAAAPVEPDPDVAVSSGDDEGMGDDDLASGDEEVLAAAGHVSLSPRRTRSSTRAASCSPDPDSPVVSPPSIPPSGVSVSPADDCDSAPSSFAAVPSSAAVGDSAPSSSAAVPSPAAGDSVPAAEPCDLSDDVALDVVAASSRALVLSATGLGPFALSLFAVCPFRSGDLFSIVDFGYTTRRIMSDTATFEMYRECHYTDRPGSVPVMSTFPSDRGSLPPDLVLDPSVLPSKFPGDRLP